MTRLADENGALDAGNGENVEDFGEVFVHGFVATTGDDDEIASRECFDGDAGGGGVGGEVVIVISDTVELADELKSMRKPLEIVQALLGL